MAEPWLEEPQPCRDPECAGIADPEQDGDLRYYACTTCGYEAGWEQVASDPSCQLGIPADTRAKLSGPPPAPAPVFLGARIGTRP